VRAEARAPREQRYPRKSPDQAIALPVG
jgi:hypothetical protein